MNFITALFTFLFGLRRTFLEETRTEDYEFNKKNLLGATFYNFGTSPVKIFGFTLRAYDEARGPDVYELDTLPYVYEDDLIVPIKFLGDNTTTKNVYIAYSTLKKCK